MVKKSFLYVLPCFLGFVLLLFCEPFASQTGSQPSLHKRLGPLQPKVAMDQSSEPGNAGNRDDILIYAPCCIVPRTKEEEAYRPGPLPDDRYEVTNLTESLRAKAAQLRSGAANSTVDLQLIWTGNADTPFTAAIELIRDEPLATLEHDFFFALENGRWKLQAYELKPIGGQTETLGPGDLRWVTVQNLFDNPNPLAQ